VVNELELPSEDVAIALGHSDGLLLLWLLSTSESAADPARLTSADLAGAYDRRPPTKPPTTSKIAYSHGLPHQSPRLIGR
jgi:hypothetical protein